ncbi:MAG: type VI secretion system-associated protein TagF [Limnobacter sp.]|jgi:type VI secretion system ImpM family protein|uniref:type VI secretion system-associated protein TagF n=1 Tax=Limnobacter sp. TaxID=2003368 RepID=UPI0022BD70B9|nr:type VI secretion system-associated protein TagF [Limnobacter sp.]MCZ8016047.1 type VI secretion system-associated protein TagF [Limnobacter sp.]
MNHQTRVRNIAWFGKLPCVGDFCSHNMSICLLSELDDWLSTAMQAGSGSHGPAWTRAYFETPIHGFVWGHNTLPALGEVLVVGVLMPSVDKAGRAFPFVLLEQLDSSSCTELSREALLDWFFHAHIVCADALNEEWPLLKLNDSLLGMPTIRAGQGAGTTLPVQREHTHWFRIDYDGQISWVMQHHGLPHAQAFGALLGLTTPSSLES